MWSGSVDEIPPKWALCDGQNGTPDLRGRFIVGAGGTYAVGAKGGFDTVTLSVAQMPSHKHGIYGDQSGSGSLVPMATQKTTPIASVERTDVITNTGGSQAHENRPPYYALCYIMRL